jgi:putative FmdB family regulatory protein
MPLFAYECASCSHVLEVIERLNAAGNEHTCPECGGTRLRKLASTFSVGTAAACGGSSCVTGSCPLAQ